MMPSDDIIKKIRALRAKATNAASTEAEMEAAAATITKLMMKHDVTDADLQERPDIDAIHAQTDMHKADLHFVVEACWSGIQKLTETKVYHTLDGGLHRYNYIGCEPDVEMALYLHEMAIMTAKRCWLLYKAESFEKGIKKHKYSRRDYYMEFGARVHRRMYDLAEQRLNARSTETGTALVLRKNDLIATKMDQMGLSLRKGRRHAGYRQRDPNAMAAGRRDAENINLNRPFSGATKERIQ